MPGRRGDGYLRLSDSSAAQIDSWLTAAHSGHCGSGVGVSCAKDDVVARVLDGELVDRVKTSS